MSQPSSKSSKSSKSKSKKTTAPTAKKVARRTVSAAKPVEAALETVATPAPIFTAAPAKTATVVAAPAKTATVAAAPAKTATVAAAPAKTATVVAAPAKTATVAAAPAKTATVVAAPAKTAPVVAAPALAPVRLVSRAEFMDLVRKEAYRRYTARRAFKQGSPFQDWVNAEAAVSGKLAAEGCRLS